MPGTSEPTAATCSHSSLRPKTARRCSWRTSRSRSVSARVAAALIEDMLWLRQPVPVEGFAPQFPNAYQARRDTDARAAVIRARRRNSLEAQLNQRLPGNIVARERKK